VWPHLIQKPEPDEAKGPGGRLIHEEAHLIATKFIETAQQFDSFTRAMCRTGALS